MQVEAEEEIDEDGIHEELEDEENQIFDEPLPPVE